MLVARTLYFNVYILNDEVWVPSFYHVVVTVFSKIPQRQPFCSFFKKGSRVLITIIFQEYRSSLDNI